MGYNIGVKFFQKNYLEKSYDQKTAFTCHVWEMFGSCFDVDRAI